MQPYLETNISLRIAPTLLLASYIHVYIHTYVHKRDMVTSILHTYPGVPKASKIL